MEKVLVKIPKVAAKYQDWTDDELLTMSFMLWCIRQETPMTEFYMYQQDMMQMMGLWNIRNGFNARLENVRRIFRIGVINDYTVSFHFNQELLKEQFKNAQVEYVEVEITDPLTIQRWSYVVGRCADKDIITEFTKPYWRKTKSAQPVFWKQRNLSWV